MAQGTALTLVASTLVVLAVTYDGSPIRDVELNDGGVWVTNGSRGLMGHLNSQVKELDLAVITTSTSESVFQQGASVQVFDDGGGGTNFTRSVTLVDVISGTTLPVPLDGDFDAAAGGGTVAVHDNDSGNTWLRRAETFTGLDVSVPPDAVVSERSGVAVSKLGTALVEDRESGTITPWRFDETGRPVAGEPIDFGTAFLDDVAVSAVGEVPVVLQGGKLYRPGVSAVDVEGESPVLQQVGPESPYVYVATSTALWRGDLAEGGELTQVSPITVDAAPAAPVVVAGCVHAAWNTTGSDNYARLCGDEPTTGEVEGLSDASVLVFRTNRDVVVLNDSATGPSWLVQEPGLTRVDDWDSVDPNATDPQVAEADDETQESERNKPPTAVDDEFGARAGTTVILPVTLNDVDPDGDVLVLTEPPVNVGTATFSVVGDGTQVQAKIGPNETGPVSFKYEISDGQPGNPPSEATVTLKLFGPSTDTAPVQIKDQKNQLRVADGYQASVNVLPAWIDPEGDAVVLVDASSESGEVGFRPDGTIDFADDGDGTGEESVQFTLRGGRVEKKGVLDVSVVDADKAEPATVADHFSGSVGSSILLEPLANDSDPLGEQLALSNLTKVSELSAQIVRDGARGTGTFRADRPGAYYLTYEATGSNGVPAVPQTIRVDVAPAAGANRPPIATRDIAAVRPGGSVLVDVLANDTDPDGDVMVVQGVSVRSGTADAVKASLINKRFVRVELAGTSDGPDPVVDYLLSDGRSDQVVGAVAVTVADAGRNRSPVAVEDLVTARAGTVISIPVLENDKDPDGDKLSVSQQDLFDIDRSKVVSGRAVPIVASGSTIRVLVPDDGTTQLQFGYGVRDPAQARADSRIVLNINPDTAKNNQKPQPRPIEDRTVTGQKIRVSVDAYGADPDGDPVVFSGVLEPPKLGRILATGTNWFEYAPLENSQRTGTDSFKVQVSDQYGLSGVVDVRIGVASPARENQAPSALDDELLIKPGLTVQYPVLRNDSDPDGDPLILTEEDLTIPAGVEARLVGEFIEVTSPRLNGRQEMGQALQYAVSDGLGSASTAVLTVTVRANAPDYAPTTQDDVVRVDQLRGKSEGDTVDVDVLSNDGDIDGSRDNLELVPVVDSQAQVVDRKLRVTLRPENQLIAYRVTDQTNQSSFGFVYVSGTDLMPPMLDTTAVPLEVVAGTTLPINLDEVVVVRPGRTPKIGNSNLIDESNGDATPRGKTALDFTAPRDFFGSASVTLPVIDGANLQDPTGLESQITIPITVLPANNEPPTVRDVAVLLYAGDEPVELETARLTADPNPDDAVTVSVKGETGGVSADIDGDRLVVTADETAPTADLLLTLVADDGEAKPVEGRLRVTVIGIDAAASNQDGEVEEVEEPKPPMTVRELTFPDASVGAAVRVDVREAILFDPFPGEAKEIVSASASGPSSQPQSSGTSLTVTPTEDGEVVVTYRLSDGSGDPARAVEGRVIVTVAGPPEQPGAPSAVEGGPDSIQLRWRAPDDNGSDITEYLVEGGTRSFSCVATQCTAEGLDAGKEYRFTVTAINAEGPSEPSAPSASVTPDTVPGTMAAPTIADDPTDRDSKLTLSWVAPTNEGSDLTGYEIRSSPLGVNIPDPGPSSTTTVVDGLTNGKGYRFEIRAVNDRGEGQWSPLSGEEVPFTKPSTMPAPTLTASNDDGRAGGFLEVTWPALEDPATGFDRIASYTVQLNRDGRELTTVTVTGGTSKSFDVENGHEYAAKVNATNRAGTSEYSDLSNASISWDKAQAVTGINKVDDCPAKRCVQNTTAYEGRVGFTTPQDDGGYPVTKYRYRTDDGRTGIVDAPTSAKSAGAAFDLPFATRNPNQSVNLVPVTQVPGVGEVEGTPATGGDFSPYAKPTPPTQSCGRADYRAVLICWTGGDGNGRAIRVTHTQGDSSGDGPGTGGERAIKTEQGGEQRCLQASAETTEGDRSDWSSNMCATAAAREVVVTVGSYGGGNPPGPCERNCDYIRVDVTGFMSNRSYAYTTDIPTSDGSPTPRGSFNTNGDGRGGREVAYYNRAIYDESYCVTVDGQTDCARGN